MSGLSRKNVAKNSNEAADDQSRNADSADVEGVDEGRRMSYVNKMLESAYKCALNERVEIGESFTYTIIGTPSEIDSPHEMTLSLMVQAKNYGLTLLMVNDEIACFRRER